jgi:myo-inositol-1(or 4)-monophosphatase
LDSRSLEPYREFLIELASATGEFIRPLFWQRDLAVESKDDATPVTEADRGAEALMRRMIHARFPSHGVFGEEFGKTNAEAEFVWVLDPIDGTKSFISGVPLFGTLIALVHQGQPVLGCIHQPILEQLMIGDGSITTLNGDVVKCRGTTQLSDATLVVCDWLSPGRYQDGAAFERLCYRERIARTWGDCYGYLLLAAGWVDVALDPIMHPWDIAALIPVVRGAGGIITGWHGDEAFHATSIVAAATNVLHGATLAALGATA